jgi:signal transduction histidine kinase
MCVPLVTRSRVLGVISFVSAESGRRFGPDDLALAEELARRAGTAVENAQLYREVEERAEAARVLETVGDGVFLVDGEGIVRLWNRAAEQITGIGRDAIVGRRLDELLGSWQGISDQVETRPLERDGRERWVSISGVTFDDGVVYAFHDITEDLALERMRQDLVATVSHELRTPLAAIYGSAVTLDRDDIKLARGVRTKLHNVIVEESERLTAIINDLLLASQLDAGRLEAHIESCDARVLTESVVEAARTHLPEGVRLELGPIAAEVPPVAADESQLRQVLDNLIDNAIKYSPAGGEVQLTVEAADEVVRFAVADSGLGIPVLEQRRIFEKFYRLDPDMTGGIGGTGLGLYIAQELVRRVDGRIWVEPNGTQGSIFYVEIPAAGSVGAPQKGRPKAAVGR